MIIHNDSEKTDINVAGSVSHDKRIQNGAFWENPTAGKTRSLVDALTKTVVATAYRVGDDLRTLTRRGVGYDVRKTRNGRCFGVVDRHSLIARNGIAKRINRRPMHHRSSLGKLDKRIINHR